MWKQILEDVVYKTFTGFGERLAAFGPRFLAMLFILLTGVLLALVLRVIVRVVFRRLGFDRFAQRLGLDLLLRKGGIERPPSQVLGALAGWATLGAFVLLAIGALDLAIAMDLVTRTFAYLPQFLIALAILLLGFLAAGFLRRSVLISAVNAGLSSARLLAAATHTAIMVLAAAMALEHLGLGRQIILASFTILFGGVVLALALAFGLAGRDLAHDFLVRLFSRPEAESDQIRHI